MLLSESSVLDQILKPSGRVRCLLLLLPKKIDIKLKGTQKKNIVIHYHSDKNIVEIRLLNPDFYELFNDLIFSLFVKIHRISDPNIYTKTLVQAFYQWIELFESKYDKKLNIQQVKGLFGEVFKLREYLAEDKNNETEDILLAWKGPYNKSNDFIFDSKNIEIKTKMKSDRFIRISSEHQLKCESNKSLELQVISVESDLVNGESLFDILNNVITILRQQLVDLSILHLSLSQLGLTVESIIEYNNYRFLVKKIERYNCTNENFPSLSISNIPQEISKLKYNLDTHGLKEFLIEEKTYPNEH